MSHLTKVELKITIKEIIKDDMREFKNHIWGEIRSMQKSIEDLDATVKENKDEIKSLMDRKWILKIIPILTLCLVFVVLKKSLKLLNH